MIRRVVGKPAILCFKLNKMRIRIVSVLSAIIIISIVAFLKMAGAKTETQKYETLFSEGNFEIRFYPKANLATVKMSGSYNQNRNSGFQTLAGYIFGGNEEDKKIAMTSPVRMSNENRNSKMSFILPRSVPFEELPKPSNKNVILHQSEPVYRASLRFGGYAKSRKIAKKKEEMIQILNKLNLQYKNNFELLGYNPPFQLLNRRNEIQVELKNFNPHNLHELNETGFNAG